MTTEATPAPAAGDAKPSSVISDAAAKPVAEAPASIAGQAATAEQTTPQHDDQSGQAQKPGAGGEQPKAPEKYELTVPVGGRVQPAEMAHIEAMARENGWSNEQAQAAVEEFDANLQANSARWLAETQADPEYGGARLDEAQRHINVALNALRPKGHPRRDALLRELDRGVGNHIVFVSLLADIGKRLAEDSPARGSAGSGSGEAQRPEDKLYDKPLTT